jgi:hypothetical protein
MERDKEGNGGFIRKVKHGFIRKVKRFCTQIGQMIMYTNWFEAYSCDKGTEV